MARYISGTMTTAQAGTDKIPYIHVEINSVDLSSRLLFLEHIEEPYRDRATLVFRNNDRYFDSLDFRGYSFTPGYGFNTGTNEYCGDGTSDGTPTLWVKNQEIISQEGSVVCQLYCEGEWMYMREQYAIALGGSAPLYEYTFNESSNDYTIYDLVEMVIETALGWTLEASIAGGSDGIIDVIYPKISVNIGVSGGVVTLEDYATFLYQLMSMTKCYLRQKAATNWEIVYPQDADSVSETYYDSSEDGHPFYEYMERLSEVIPNRIKTACNSPDGMDWSAIITGDTGAYSGNYVEVPEIHLYPWITTQGNANLVAAAILTKLKSEGLAGRVIVPHDCKVELYDKVLVVDARGL